LKINEVGIFSKKCMSKLLDYQYKYDDPTALADFLYNQNEWIGFSFYWLGILIELTVIFFIFTIEKINIAGFLLILLHVGIALILQVEFYHNFIVLFPLLVLNPISSKSRFYKFLEK